MLCGSPEGTLVLPSTNARHGELHELSAFESIGHEYEERLIDVED